MLKETAKDFVTRLDGWMNLLTGMGLSSRDRKLHTSFGRTLDFLNNEEILNSIYAEDGIGSRIIDVLVEDMTRAWFTVNGDTDNYVNQKLEQIDGKFKIIQLLTWASLQGGAIGVIGIDDGGEYTDEVNTANIRDITHIHTYNKWRVNVAPTDYYLDPKNPKYNTPMLYEVFPIGMMGTIPFKVHESRVIRFEGKDCSDRDRITNNGWGDSDLKSGYNRIKGLGEAFDGVEHIMGEFVMGILRMKNLQSLIAAGKEDKIRTRMDLIDMSKHVLNTMLLDENEEFSRLGMPVTGLPELLDRCVQAVSSCYGIPVTVLLGISPAGLNATGASDIRRYYDKIAARQEMRIRGPLEKLIRYIMLSKESGFKGIEPEEWSIVFKPLWEPTEMEIVDMRWKQAQTDQIYITNNVLDPDEVAESRFGGEEYSIETQIDEGRERKEENEEQEE